MNIKSGVVMVVLAVFGSAFAKESVFFVGAHPDDSIAMAGTLFLMKDKFDIHLFDYTRGDYLLDALMSVVLEYPKNRAVGMARGGVERVMANSKYGDVFDVIVPGGDHPETFRRALLEHKVAFLAGDFDFDPETQKAIDRFVAEGGEVGDVPFGAAQPSRTHRPAQLRNG